MLELRDHFTMPKAGWLSLGLLAVMSLALAWSVQDAGWLERLDFLVPLALWSLVVGAVLGAVRWTILIALPLAGVIGAWFILSMIGAEYYPALDEVGRAFALREDAVAWTLTVLQTGYPLELSPYAVGLGILMWATGCMAAYTVYRYHRVLDAIVLLGAALLTNMSATFADLFGHLLLFVVAALLLWLRASLVERQDGWQRRRVNENLEVPAGIMRTGILLAGGSLVLALTLTSVAVAAPLTGAWRSLDGVWTDLRDGFEGVFGSLENPQSRLSGNSFGRSFTVFGEWRSNEREAIVLAAPRALYLRTTTYDAYTGRGWQRTDGTTRRVPAGEPLFGVPTPERPTVAAAVDVRDITVEMQQTVGRNIFTAGSPLAVYAPVVLHESGGQPVLGGIEAVTPLHEGEAYEMTVAISKATEAELGSAGTDYPETVRSLYLDDSLVTARVAELAREVTAEADNPYEQAEALARFLTGPDFTYATNGPVVPGDGDLVDTFLFAEDGRRGYCQYYASAMVMMARSLGLPARVAVGFAPGESIGEGLFLQREANAHAWAEIYFPGYGWEIFEATKSIESRFVRLPGESDDGRTPRDPVADPLLLIDDWRDPSLRGLGALPSPDLVEGAVDPDALIDPTADDEGASAARTGNALVIGAIVLAAAALVWLRRRQLEHRWRLLPAGDRAWSRLTSAADRAGVGPRPTETIYEYAGWLEDQLPQHGVPIRVVADGKVWQSYSGRRLTASATNKLEVAWATLRLPLLWLAIRRGVRRLVRRSPAP